ncbi:hypothetical protein HZF05_10405 [Sphingomonas sp. CGMCC 1.13654]|uniref:Lipoprotein n=1 Tax=Sphingomonas chungangi TaxID=2683589 RepID=A0A838L640_9SPHN|nr:hypothetical protein [Sphingomonas chungangi]MBA2934507.1 hypothetical protein [Sphingomonas chungangi]MVW57546.1 hypothetical protein [Sphingomonas chungangi]
MRAILAAILGCVFGGCTASGAALAKPVGLTCTAANGAIVRLNLDIAARRYQKEGFPSVPIESVTDHRVVLMHDKTATLVVTAFLDRDTMTYVAASEEALTHQRSETRYACVIGPAFSVANTG